MGFSQLLKVNGSYQTLAPFKTNRWCFFILFNIFLDFFPMPKTRANLPLSLSLRMKLFGDNRVACSVFLGFTGLEQRRIWALKQTVLQTTDGAGRLTSTYCQAWPPESVPRSHLVEGENQVLQVVLWCPHWHGGMNTCFLLPWPKEIDKWKQRDGRPHLKLLTKEVGGGVQSLPCQSIPRWCWWLGSEGNTVGISPGLLRKWRLTEPKSLFQSNPAQCQDKHPIF